MKLSRAIAQFIQETGMSRAKATANGYGQDLQQLVSRAPRDTVLAFDDQLVTDFFQWLSSQGCEMSTMHRKATSVKQFARWGVRKGLWLKNPMDDPKFKFRRIESLPKPFEEDEARRIMELQLPEKQAVIRALLYYTGLRVSPIANIRIGDISFAPLAVSGQSLPGSIRTLSKGGKRQLVPMAPELAEILKTWLQKHPGQAHEPLLRNQYSHPMNRRSIERYTKEWGEKAGVGNCIPHRFRHTYATDLRRQGVALDVIQRLLGHSSIATTQIYAKVADREVIDAVLMRRAYATSSTPLSNAAV